MFLKRVGLLNEGGSDCLVRVKSTEDVDSCCIYNGYV